jgi:hypothetical protein
MALVFMVRSSIQWLFIAEAGWVASMEAIECHPGIAPVSSRGAFCIAVYPPSARYTAIQTVASQAGWWL